MSLDGVPERTMWEEDYRHAPSEDFEDSEAILEAMKAMRGKNIKYKCTHCRTVVEREFAPHRKAEAEQFQAVVDSGRALCLCCKVKLQTIDAMHGAVGQLADGSFVLPR